MSTECEAGVRLTLPGDVAAATRFSGVECQQHDYKIGQRWCKWLKMGMTAAKVYGVME